MSTEVGFYFITALFRVAAFYNYNPCILVYCKQLSCFKFSTDCFCLVELFFFYLYCLYFQAGCEFVVSIARRRPEALVHPHTAMLLDVGTGGDYSLSQWGSKNLGNICSKSCVFVQNDAVFYLERRPSISC